jgi:hypothetical protein
MTAPFFPHPPVADCPAACDLPRALLCWLRRRRELIVDLAAATASGNDHDSAVLQPRQRKRVTLLRNFDLFLQQMDDAQGDAA